MLLVDKAERRLTRRPKPRYFQAFYKFLLAMNDLQKSRVRDLEAPCIPTPAKPVAGLENILKKLDCGEKSIFYMDVKGRILLA